MITAQEAFRKTTQVLKEKIDPEMIQIMADKIQKAIQEGKTECVIKKEDLGLQGVSKQMRYLETFARSNGYRAEVGYGLGNIKIAWL